MTITEVLRKGTELLQKSLIDSAPLDAEILLAFVLEVERSALFRDPERALSAEQQEQFTKFVDRRAKHEPVAYLVGHKEFYGRDFVVDQHVLIPRPESELLIEQCKEHMIIHSYRTIADIGTGSGCLAVTLALEFPNVHVIATDISQEALRVARENAERYHVTERVTFLWGNLLEPLKEHSKLDVIVANLPYVPVKERGANPDLSHEPDLALSGMKKTEVLFAEFLDQWSARPDHPIAFLEIHPAMREFLEREAERRGISMTFQQDLSGKDRVIMLEWTHDTSRL